MLLAGNNPPILELEHNAAAHIQMLAIALPGVLMNAYDVTILTPQHVQQLGLEGSRGLPAIPGKLGLRIKD